MRLCLQAALILLPQVKRRHTESWMPLQEAWRNLAASLCQVSVKSVLVDYTGLIMQSHFLQLQGYNPVIESNFCSSGWRYILLVLGVIDLVPAIIHPRPLKQGEDALL